MAARVVVTGGAGDMGRTLCAQLAASDRVGRVVVADRDGEAAERVAAELSRSSAGRLEAADVDLLDGDATRKLLSDADFVANAAGPFFRLGVPTLEAAIAAGTPYLDICDDPEPTERMLELDERAREAGVAAVIGMGASPGLSNLLARRAADRLDRVIDCYTVWPLDGAGEGAEDALDSARPASGPPPAAVVHLMQQISGRIRVVEAGELVDATPLQSVDLDFPGLGSGTAVTVGHPEPVTLHRSLGVEGRCANAMLVEKSTGAYLDGLRRDMDAGTLDVEQAAAELLAPTATRGAAALARSLAFRGAGRLPPFFALLRGERDGRRYRVGCHVTTLPPGMAAVTSIPAALAVHQLLERPAAPGVHPPDVAVDGGALLAALLPHCPGQPADVNAFAPVSEAPE